MDKGVADLGAGCMKLYLVFAFLVMINIAAGVVGDAGVSDTEANSYVPYESVQSGQAAQGNYPAQDKYTHGQVSTYRAPQIGGPMREQMTAEELGLTLPEMDSFAPDESLGFSSASPPGNTAQMASSPVQPSVQTAVPGYSIWHYPNSVASANRFYVQTTSGLSAVGGCSFKGYLPLWADIKSSGNFFVYEWYPGRSTPTVQSLGWTAAGWKKGWFCGEVAGWHILCYNSGIWSNYIYIYVYPSMTAASLPSGAPVPPDPGSERIVLPDFNMFKPVTEEYTQSNFIAPSPSIADQAGVSGSYPYANPAIAASPGLVAPYCNVAQSYKAVYPVPSVCKCNEYYVQSCPGELATVAGVFCGEWLPIWSKVSRPDSYWSFEWTACSSGPGYYCQPDVKNFGYKSAGWYQTRFKANNPGWHILSYYCNDWSNYIYIYVWPKEKSLADQSV